MVSDGIGFNGWLATDYYQGLAGKQSYQSIRPDGTKPTVLALEHGALNFINAQGDALPRNSEVSDANGVMQQLYDPQTRWNVFENAMINDFSPVGSYTTYTDSAAAGTALFSGRKTTVGRVNVDWTGERNFTTIAELAMQQGLSAGAVSSVMASHATPAAVISHNTSRNNYADIFNEMVSSGLDVIMGAGHPMYDNNGKLSEKLDFKYVGGEQTYTTMISDKGLNGFQFVDNKQDFDALAQGELSYDRVVGIAQVRSTLQASRDGTTSADTPYSVPYNQNVPDLATMSLGALNVLNQNEKGFFVMIEGGAVDWMGHANHMPRFIEEQVDFNRAIDAVIDWVETHSNWDETLLIVTSDHETGGIWGLNTWTNSEGGAIALDRSDEAIKAARFDPTKDTFNEYLAVQDQGAGNVPSHQWASGNHTNDLVPMWAIGNGAKRFNEFTRTDLKAAKLWGAHYGWDGHFIDNTVVFEVMKDVLNEDTF